jgi:hypothetical protein
MLDVLEEEACSMIALMSSFDDGNGEIPHGRPGSRGDASVLLSTVACGGLLMGVWSPVTLLFRTTSCHSLPPEAFGVVG